MTLIKTSSLRAQQSNPEGRRWIAASLALLATTLLLTACGTYKTPTVSNPQAMSAETLCYRYAYAKSDPALADEVRARRLDCDEILGPPPGMDNGMVGGSRW